MQVCLKLFCTIANVQKIPAEIILGHEHVFVSIWPANGEAVCAEDLAVKRVWCVCERLCDGVSRVCFFLCDKNYNTASVWLHVKTAAMFG